MNFHNHTWNCCRVPMETRDRGAAASTARAVVTVVAAIVTPEEVLTLHLTLRSSYQTSDRNNAGLTDLQTCDVSVTKIFAKLLDLLQLQQVYPQHLYGYDHQIIHLLVTREKSFLVFLLMLKMFISL